MHTGKCLSSLYPLEIVCFQGAQLMSNDACIFQSFPCTQCTPLFAPFETVPSGCPTNINISQMLLAFIRCMLPFISRSRSFAYWKVFCNNSLLQGVQLMYVYIYIYPTMPANIVPFKSMPYIDHAYCILMYIVLF